MRYQVAAITIICCLFQLVPVQAIFGNAQKIFNSIPKQTRQIFPSKINSKVLNFHDTFTPNPTLRFNLVKAWPLGMLLADMPKDFQ